MSNLRRVLKRQKQEEEEIRRRRTKEDCEADEEEEEIVVAMCMLNESRKHHHRRGSNVDQHRQSRGKNLLEDYFIPNLLHPKYVAIGVLSLLPEQKLTAALCMLAYGASADQVDEIARMGKSIILECFVRFCDAVENLYKREYAILRLGTSEGLYKKLRLEWKNCPTAWQGDYGNRKSQKSTILEAVASFDTWVWHASFGVAGSQNDLNMLGQSPVFNDVLRGHSPPQITYRINNIVYLGAYYLADRIYPRWMTFMKNNFESPIQEGKKLCCLSRGGAARMVDEEVL
ncbi:unnamed protein product [Prunus armeniaca]